MKRVEEPFFWALFSAGGVISALLLPIYVLLFALLEPMGVVHPGYDGLHALLQNPLARVYLLALCTLPLFHWAHRFRFTLYDGLQIKHLNALIFAFCYGGAIVGSLLAMYLLWNVR